MRRCRIRPQRRETPRRATIVRLNRPRVPPGHRARPADGGPGRLEHHARNQALTESHRPDRQLTARRAPARRRAGVERVDLGRAVGTLRQVCRELGALVRCQHPEDVAGSPAAQLLVVDRGSHKTAICVAFYGARARKRWLNSPRCDPACSPPAGRPATPAPPPRSTALRDRCRRRRGGNRPDPSAGHTCRRCRRSRSTLRLLRDDVPGSWCRERHRAATSRSRSHGSTRGPSSGYPGSDAAAIGH